MGERPWKTLIVVSVLCLLSVETRAQESEAYVVLKSSMVVSDSPYDESSVVSLLPAGTKVPVVGYTNGSWLVGLVGGKTGYLKDMDLESVSDLADAVRRGDRRALLAKPKVAPPAVTPPPSSNPSPTPDRTTSVAQPVSSVGPAFIVPSQTTPLRTSPDSDATKLPLHTVPNAKLTIVGYDGGFWRISTPIGDGYVEDKFLLEVSPGAMVHRREQRRRPGQAAQQPGSRDSEPMTPCTDPVYLKLRTIDINEMTEREFSVFVEKDRACNNYMVK